MAAAKDEVPEVSVEYVVRKLRPHRARARTESVNRLSKTTLERGRRENPTPEGVVRPTTRADCLPGGCNEARPCPFAGCRWHLAIEVNEDTGAIKYNQPDREVWEMGETCALDVADRGEHTLEQVGDLLNIVRERIRQVEHETLARLRWRAERLGLRDAQEPEEPEWPVPAKFRTGGLGGV